MPLDAAGEARIDEALAACSLEEKVAMAAGSGLWYSTPVERTGIPSFKMSDGPNGVRGDSRTSGVTSTCFPAGTALAASWDVDLIGEVGAALARESRAKGVDVLLGPTINLHRSPLAGRNFECYSEDALLTAELAIAYTRAVQGGGVAVCLKHFACNDSEFHRHSISSVVDARTLHETYLRPFERAIREAGAWSVMSAYNRLNGVYCSANPWLLDETLRRRWGFDGVVISDWGGTYDTVGPANAGLDLEMPGPAQKMGEHLLAAVRAGEVPEAAVDAKVRNQLRLMVRTGRLDAPEHEAERSEDPPAHRALARRAAAAGTVLLKNDGDLLPLDGVRSVALIGPNAVNPQIQGGGSSGVSPHEVVSFEAGLRDALPGAEVTVAEGCLAHRYLPLLDPAQCRVETDSDRTGLTVEFFAGFECAGEPALTTHPRRSELLFFGRFADAVPQDFSARVTTVFTPRVDGAHAFSLVSAGTSMLRIDGETVVDNRSDWRRGESYFGNGSGEVRGVCTLAAGRPVTIEVEFSRELAPRLAGLRIGVLEPQTRDLLAEAEDAARAADVAVVVIGLNPEWETEGVDRLDMHLPAGQDDLVVRVASANPNTVVVLNAGSIVDTGAWRDAVPTILQCWYPGQAAGAALADVLTGAVEPGGRLPTTIPARYADHPAFLNYPGEAGEVRYGEGVFIGYRGYQERALPVAFPFGHGLGYTQFAVETATVEASGDGVVVRATVRNVGARAGATIVQVYAGAPGERVRRPPRELCAFRRVALDAGASTELAIPVVAARLACFDPSVDAFVVEPGAHRFEVGFSSEDLVEAGTVETITGPADA
jgi:beta-glucosidase